MIELHILLVFMIIGAIVAIEVKDLLSSVVAVGAEDTIDEIIVAGHSVTSNTVEILVDKEMIVDSDASDIVYSSLFTGIHGSYLKGSISKSGLDPDNLPEGDKLAMDFDGAAKSDAKAWRDVWGAGQGVGNIDAVLPAGQLIMQIEQEYHAARRALELG